MKYCRLILVLLLVLVACLTACGEEESDRTFDFMKEDLSEYVTLGEYRGLTFEYEMAAVTDKDVEGAIGSLLNELAAFVEYEEVPADQKTAEFDYLMIDYKGYMDGVAFEGGTASGQGILLCEDNGYIAFFDDDLYGVTVGTTVETTGHFPDDYYEDLAGKEVTFQITVTAILGRIERPELTDELIAENTDSKTVEEYRTYLREAIMEERKAAASASLYSDIWDRLEKTTVVKKYPEAQLNSYFEMYLSYVKDYAAYAGYEDYKEFMEKELTLTEEDMWEDARLSTREDLIFFAIAKAEKLTVSDEEYETAVAAYAEADGVTVEELETALGKDYLRDCVLYDKTVTFVMENADVRYIEK